MAKLAIESNTDKVEEIINLFNMLGSKNASRISLNPNCVYCIDDNSSVQICDPSTDAFIVLTMEMFNQLYPFKVGDYVTNTFFEITLPQKIEHMRWNGGAIEYQLANSDVWFHQHHLKVVPNTEITTIQNNNSDTICVNADIDIQNESCIDLRNKTFDEKVELILGGKYEVQIEDGRTFIVKKKDEPMVYPQSFEECCDILQINQTHSLFSIFGNEYKKNSLVALQRLLVRLHAYWHLAENWKPDWTDENSTKWVICRKGNKIVTDIAFKNYKLLAFPTEEMRNVFLDNFKFLIEECMDLI